MAPAQVPKVGFTRTNSLSFAKPCCAKNFQERAGLAARDDEAVNLVELLGLADEDHVGAQFFEAFLVGVEIALDGENTDSHRSFRPPADSRQHLKFQLRAGRLKAERALYYQPLVCSMCASSSRIRPGPSSRPPGLR